MSDEQNTTQKPIPEENSIPPSPQEPMADAPIPPIDSEPVEVLPEAPEASREGFSDESTNIPPSNSTPTPEEAIPLEPTDMQANPTSNGTNEPSIESVFEPVQAIEPPTAQIPVNEPLKEPETSQNEQAKPVSEQPKSNLARELLITARNAIQFRKRKKLDRVMSLFENKNGSTSSPRVTNDEVEKFLHVSDATATRYLSQLEKEGKIKQNGKTGHSVFYSEI
ncbi:MAG: hypothetical protein WC735_02730 [Candidatus Paceibacterota bacterium]|jgi:hypothetical protein